MINSIANGFLNLKLGLGFGAGEGFQILDLPNVYFMGYQKLKN